MSIVSISAALETALNAMSPALATAWENVPYTPVSGTPYQQVNILFADVSNPETGLLEEHTGYMQITLRYPLDVGSSVAKTRAELIKSAFKRASTFTSGSVNVSIINTPSVTTSGQQEDRWVILVKIPFKSYIN